MTLAPRGRGTTSSAPWQFRPRAASAAAQPAGGRSVAPSCQVSASSRTPAVSGSVSAKSPATTLAAAMPLATPHAGSADEYTQKPAGTAPSLAQSIKHETAVPLTLVGHSSGAATHMAAFAAISAPRAVIALTSATCGGESGWKAMSVAAAESAVASTCQVRKAQ